MVSNRPVALANAVVSLYSMAKKVVFFAILNIMPTKYFPDSANIDMVW